MEAKKEICSMEGKKCTNPKCGKWKPLQDFYTKGRSSTGKTIFESICKECKSFKYAEKKKSKKKKRVSRHTVSELTLVETFNSDDVLEREMENFLNSLAYKIFSKQGDKNE